MNRKQQKVVIGTLRISGHDVAEGERLAREVPTLDLGPLDADRRLKIIKLRDHVVATCARLAALHNALDDMLGATEVLDRAKYPRAKALSKGKPT